MIFGLFKSKERKDVESALQQLLEALNVAKRIIEIDSERFPTSVLLAAEKFNHHNVKGLSMLYAIAKHYNWPEELDTELDMHKKLNEYEIKIFLPKYVLSKKDYEQFQTIMNDALLGKFGEYKGV
tara:strand:+ start:65 stop:439 length:375 start_codon:yes stop_codon:yes gene_type:complete